jgi:hypothetical protein
MDDREQQLKKHEDASTSTLPGITIDESEDEENAWDPRTAK